MEPRARREILIVDDSTSMREMAADTVRGLGRCNVVEACDGLEALEKLATTEFALVITDLNMPFVDGLKLLEWIRTRSKSADVPVVILSTETSTQDFEVAMGRGATAYLTKPVKATQLRAVLADIIGR